MMNKLMIKLITLYQKSKTPNTRKWCKYSPTCSNYALQAYKKFGFIKATFLMCFRILRCNPFSKGGYDPVPLSKFERLVIGKTYQ